MFFQSSISISTHLPPLAAMSSEAARNKAAALFEQLGYDEIKKLGQGGMGIAHRARNRRDGSIRVLKVNVTTGEEKNDDEEQELVQEGQLLKTLLGKLFETYLIEFGVGNFDCMTNLVPISFKDPGSATPT